MTTVREDVVEIVVYGIPQQQGTKTRWGAEENPHVKGWRQSIAEEASTIVSEPIHGPVEVDVEFVFPRPLSHFRGAAGELRVTAPYWKPTIPDLDKLQRAVGDALSGVVLVDDRQIVSWTARKRYGKQARVEILVSPVEEPS